jgi:hypothetical protein
MNNCKKSSFKNYSKNLGEKSGLDSRVIDRLPSAQLNFYLQNKDQMNIKLNNSNGINYLFTGMELILSYYFNRDERIGFRGLKNIIFGRLILNEQEFSDYLNSVNSPPF